MTEVGGKGGTLHERVYRNEDVSERVNPIEQLLDRSGDAVSKETMAAALFRIFETKTSIRPETARLRFRRDGSALLSVPDKTFHIELRLEPGERYDADDAEAMAAATASDHDLLLITTNALTTDARAAMEECPRMHFIRLQRALQFDEVGPRPN